MPWSSVACEEEAFSQRENYSENGFTASVTLRCAWDNRHALVQDLLITTRPAWHGLSNVAYPVTASITPFGSTYSVSSGNINAYEDALVTVNWSTEAEADLISESLEPTAEFQTLDYRWFRWSSGDPLLDSEAPGRLVRGLNLVRTLYKRASIPAVVLTAVGKCNAAPMTSSILGLTFAEETLLYTPPTLNRAITTGGSKGWDITLKFRYNPETWNKFWRAKTMQYEEITLLDGTVYKNHPTTDLSALLA